MEKISKTVKNPFVLAIALNLIPLLVYLAFGSGKFDSLDDYFMSSVLTGAYGSEYDVHLYFVNVIFGYALKPFYLLFPTVGWYYIFEIGAAFVSFSAITYVLLKRCGYGGGLVLSSLILTTVAPEFYFGMNFTQCAEILTAAGTLLLVVGSFERIKLWACVGSLMMIWGYMMRENAFLLAMPFVVVMIVFYVIKKKYVPKELLVAGICCCFAVWSVNKIDKGAYETPEYKAYATFQDPRATLGDVRYYDFDAAYSDLEERGFSGNDLRAARNWMFYDTDVFSVSGIQPMLQAINHNRYELDTWKTIASVILKFSKSLWSTNAWCWVLLGLLLTLHLRGKFRLLPWISLCLIALCLGYLFYVNRVVHHVEVGIWLYGTVMLLPFVEKYVFDGFFFSRRALIGLGVFLTTLFSCAVFFTSDVQNQVKSVGLDQRKKELQKIVLYANEHLDDAFLFPFELYKSLGACRNEISFRAVEPGSWQNIFPLGYWNVYLPGMNRELEKRGVNNPLKDLIKNGVYYVQERGALIFGPQSVWEEHYGFELSADTIQRFGNFDVLKFYVKRDGYEK